MLSFCCIALILPQNVIIFSIILLHYWTFVPYVVTRRSQVVRIFDMFYQPWVRVFVDVRGPQYDIMKPNFTDSRRLFRFVWHETVFFLARSANLPTGLYILPSIISFFFDCRPIISGSTRPIFAIFASDDRNLFEYDRSGPLFDSSRDVANATN